MDGVPEVHVAAEGGQRRELFERREDAVCDTRGGSEFTEVYDGAVYLALDGHFRSPYELCHFAEPFPQFFAGTVDGGRVLDLVLEAAVREERAEVAAELRECRPVFHFLEVLEGDGHGVGVQDVERSGVEDTFADCAGEYFRRVPFAVAEHLADFHVLLDFPFGDFQREVVFHIVHRGAEHTHVYFVIPVARGGEEFVLYPVGESAEARVEDFFHEVHVFFGDVHVAQFDGAVGHFVGHVDVHQVSLRDFPFHFHSGAVVGEGAPFGAGELVEVGPVRFVLAQDFGGFPVEYPFFGLFGFEAAVFAGLPSLRP